MLDFVGIFSITFPDIETSLTGLLFPDSSFMPLLKTKHSLDFFQFSDAFYGHCDFQTELRKADTSEHIT